MQPALLPDNRIVFASPVPRLGTPAQMRAQIPQLYVQSFGAAAHQLTFGPSGAIDPTVLLDGRILFVASQPSPDDAPVAGQALYTINNDGTELMPFAGQHERASIIQQPRQLPDGRVGFLARDLQASEVPQATFEFINLARPFFGRLQLFRDSSFFVHSVRPASNGELLVCAEASIKPSSAHSSSAVFRVARQENETARVIAISSDKAGGGIGSKISEFTTPIFSDPDWNALEAIEALPHARPMGRLSNMDPAKRTGQILCLNANDTSVGRATNGAAPMATRVRVLAGSASGAAFVLGEVSVQADGSFMAEVPSDVPLGFEALDDEGQVLRHVAPIIWVRPGENRSCIGCHEPHNHSPHNHRPLAVRAPVPCFGIANRSASKLHAINVQTGALPSPRDFTRPPDAHNLVAPSSGMELKPGT
jgi:Hydrazine synthase alpha subunit middle domain